MSYEVKCNRYGKVATSWKEARDTFVRYSKGQSKSTEFQPKCKQCKKETTIPTRENGIPGYLERERETNRKRRYKYYTDNVEKIRLHLGGKIECEKCGYTDSCFAPFDFHHVDPATKEFGIHKKIDTSPFESWKSEIDKCILICSNCHRKIHSKRCKNENESK